MSGVEQIEGRIRDLSPDELGAFREWFAEFDGDVRDRQTESDARSGKLDSLVQKALRDHADGRSTRL